jgi:hypothetical protein
MGTDLWKVVADVAKLTEGECVFIGGVAVYVYTQRSAIGLIPEATHDVDASITIAASGTLRDHQLLTQNKRLKKAQISPTDLDLTLGNITKADSITVTQVLKSTAFMDIARRNAQAAAKLRSKAQSFLDLVKKGAL